MAEEIDFAINPGGRCLKFDLTIDGFAPDDFAAAGVDATQKLVPAIENIKIAVVEEGSGNISRDLLAF